MKKILTISLLAITLTACVSPVRSPLNGNLYSEATFGEMATTETRASKKGEACAVSALSLIAVGDASINAAKKDGEITKVSTVDYSSYNILGIYGKYCTIVRGE